MALFTKVPYIHMHNSHAHTHNSDTKFCNLLWEFLYLTDLLLNWFPVHARSWQQLKTRYKERSKGGTEELASPGQVYLLNGSTKGLVKGLSSKGKRIPSENEGGLLYLATKLVGSWSSSHITKSPFSPSYFFLINTFLSDFISAHDKTVNSTDTDFKPQTWCLCVSFRCLNPVATRNVMFFLQTQKSHWFSIHALSGKLHSLY